METYAVVTLPATYQMSESEAAHALRVTDIIDIASRIKGYLYITTRLNLISFSKWCERIEEMQERIRAGERELVIVGEEDAQVALALLYTKDAITSATPLSKMVYPDYN